VKFLDASEPLSVQVHPPSGTRGELGEGKSEAWYILDADAGSKLWIGLKSGTTHADLERTAAKRDVLQHVLEWPAKRGELAFIPGGTVHAIGGGITLLEVQENADTTHRLYDWDRPGLDGKPRALQPRESIASTNVHASPKPSPAQFKEQAGESSTPGSSTIAASAWTCSRSPVRDRSKPTTRRSSTSC
jgi:mannose-6-phosphate isomerase